MRLLKTRVKHAYFCDERSLSRTVVVWLLVHSPSELADLVCGRWWLNVDRCIAVLSLAIERHSPTLAAYHHYTAALSAPIARLGRFYRSCSLTTVLCVGGLVGVRYVEGLAHCHEDRSNWPAIIWWYRDKQAPVMRRCNVTGSDCGVGDSLAAVASEGNGTCSYQTRFMGSHQKRVCGRGSAANAFLCI